MDVPIDHPNHDRLAQQAGQDRLAACVEFMWHHEEWGEHTPDECGGCPDDPSSAPFCGCDVCQVREVLDAAYPYLQEMLKVDMQSVEPGSVLLLRLDAETPPCVAEALSDALDIAIQPSAVIMCHREMSLEVLDPVALESAGWVRKV